MAVPYQLGNTETTGSHNDPRCLFYIFLSDIPQFTSTPGLAVFQFEDDTALLAVSNSLERTQGKMEKALKIIEKYAKTWKIEINQSKTKPLLIAKKRPARNCINFMGSKVKFKSMVKYLGVDIDRTLEFRTPGWFKMEERLLESDDPALQEIGLRLSGSMRAVLPETEFVLFMYH